MATIAISNLSLAGSELFLDGESYLGEISAQELDNVQGGLTWSWYVAAAVVGAVGGGLAGCYAACRLH